MEKGEELVEAFKAGLVNVTLKRTNETALSGEGNFWDVVFNGESVGFVYINHVGKDAEDSEVLDGYYLVRNASSETVKGLDAQLNKVERHLELNGNINFTYYFK